MLTNQEMLGPIEGRCEGVEFVGQAEVEDAARAVANVRRHQEELDGLLYFGALPRRWNHLVGYNPAVAGRRSPES